MEISVKTDKYNKCGGKSGTKINQCYSNNI